MAPFDQALSQRVQALAAESDELTAQLVHSRRTVPERKAEALAARANAVKMLAEREEEKRREVTQEWQAREKDNIQREP